MEINGKPITVDDIKYYAKIEHQRTYKGTDKKVRENQPFATKILQLKNEVRKIERGETDGNIKKIEKKIAKLEAEAPHQQNGKRRTFDTTFGYKRNYAESYKSKKDFIKNPRLYFSTLLGLPASEKAVAFKILGKAGVPTKSIPTNKVQLALKTIRYLKRGVDIAIKSGSIGV